MGCSAIVCEVNSRETSATGGCDIIADLTTSSIDLVRIENAAIVRYQGNPDFTVALYRRKKRIDEAEAGRLRGLMDSGII